MKQHYGLLSSQTAAGIRRAKTHLLIEGEPSYREYDRTVETDSGPVKIKWPVAEVVVHSIAPLDRQTKEREAA